MQSPEFDNHELAADMDADLEASLDAAIERADAVERRVSHLETALDHAIGGYAVIEDRLTGLRDTVRQQRETAERYRKRGA